MDDHKAIQPGSLIDSHVSNTRALRGSINDHYELQSIQQTLTKTIDDLAFKSAMSTNADYYITMQNDYANHIAQQSLNNGSLAAAQPSEYDYYHGRAGAPAQPRERHAVSGCACAPVHDDGVLGAREVHDSALRGLRQTTARVRPWNGDAAAQHEKTFASFSEKV